MKINRVDRLQGFVERIIEESYLVGNKLNLENRSDIYKVLWSK